MEGYGGIDTAWNSELSGPHIDHSLGHIMFMNSSGLRPFASRISLKYLLYPFFVDFRDQFDRLDAGPHCHCSSIPYIKFDTGSRFYKIIIPFLTGVSRPVDGGTMARADGISESVQSLTRRESLVR